MSHESPREPPARPRGLSLSDKFELSDERGLGFHGPTKSEHVEKSTLKKQHQAAFKTLNEEVEKNDDKPVRPFVPYDQPACMLERRHMARSWI